MAARVAMKSIPTVSLGEIALRRRYRREAHDNRSGIDMHIADSQRQAQGHWETPFKPSNLPIFACSKRCQASEVVRFGSEGV